MEARGGWMARTDDGRREAGQEATMVASRINLMLVMIWDFALFVFVFELES